MLLCIGYLFIRITILIRRDFSWSWQLCVTELYTSEQQTYNAASLFSIFSERLNHSYHHRKQKSERHIKLISASEHVSNNGYEWDRDI